MKKLIEMFANEIAFENVNINLQPTFNTNLKINLF